MILFVLIAGVKHAKWTVILGLLYSVGRLFAAIGYTKSVGMRRPGTYLFNLALVGLFGLSVHTLVTL